MPEQTGNQPFLRGPAWRRTVVGYGFALGVLFSGLVFGSDFADTVQRVKQSIVGVGTVETTRRPPHRFAGTGFVVMGGSHVLTNAHVIPDQLNDERREYLAVFLPADNGRKPRRAVVVKRDAEHDLALLSIEGPLLPALVLGDDRQVREGQHFAFTGFPIGPVLGLYPVTHAALIAAISPIAIPVSSSRQLNPALIRKLEHPYPVFQLDATAYPGNSGSPLYHRRNGEVVGIINQVFVKGGREFALERPSGITYAIPSRFAIRLIDSLGE